MKRSELKEMIQEIIKEEKTQMCCMECGNKFNKKIGSRTYEIKCPKCKSYDTEPC